MSRALTLSLFMLAVFTPTGTIAKAQTSAEQNDTRARVNYMLNCQGCHGANAEGNKRTDVPRMRDQVGNFLRVPGGREYLVQVPGSANASVSDAQLAELLNWMLPNISAAQLPPDFVPYTEAEIRTLRYSPEEDVQGTREDLITALRSLRVNYE
jgi:mono/diheme cytochrome c family protein